MNNFKVNSINKYNSRTKHSAIIESELLELHNEFKEYSLQKEISINKFLNNIQIANTQSVTGEFTDLEYTVMNYQSKYNNSIIQRMGYLDYYAREVLKLESSAFMTLTLPSQYHPFKKSQTQFNPKFAFNSIVEAGREGYKKISDFWDTFQISLRKKAKSLGTEIKHLRIAEGHQSMQVHFHIILYSSQELIEWAESHFWELLKTHSFNSSQALSKKTNDFKIIKAQEGHKKSAVLMYIKKYIKKTIESAKQGAGAEYNYHYFMDGWKKKMKIVIFRSSNTPFSNQAFQKLYFSLSKEDTKFYRDLAANNKTNLMVELSKVTEVQIKQYKISNIEKQDNLEISTLYHQRVFDKETVYSLTDKPKYTVFIERTKIDKVVLDTHESDNVTNKLLNDILSNKENYTPFVQEAYKSGDTKAGTIIYRLFYNTSKYSSIIKSDNSYIRKFIIHINKVLKEKTDFFNEQHFEENSTYYKIDKFKIAKNHSNYSKFIYDKEDYIIFFKNL